MSADLHRLFQVIVSGGFSFVGAAGMVLVFAPLLRIRDGRARLAVVLLPFAKLLVELARGIPDDAFFWLKTHGAQQELGAFRFGFGIDRYGPRIDWSLAAKWHGAMHPQSAAEPLSTALERHVVTHGTAIAGAVLGALMLVGVIRTVAVVVVRRRRVWLDGARPIEVRTLGCRRVTVVASPSWDGVPFATGLFTPSICIPERLVATLARDEWEAVVEHELAHVKGFHVILAVLIDVLTHAFWFLPGVRALARDARAQLEVCADDGAVRAGVAPDVLASAIVRVAEVAASERSAPGLAFLGHRSILLARVERLLASSSRRCSLLFAALRMAALVFVADTVLRATTFGNP